MANKCEEADHNFVKVATEKRRYIDNNWNARYYFVYIMCCTKCGKTFEVEGGTIV